MQIQTQQYYIKQQYKPNFGLALKDIKNVEVISKSSRRSVLECIISDFANDLKDIGNKNTQKANVEAEFRVQRNNDVFMTLKATDKGLTQYVITRLIDAKGVSPKECPLELFKTALIKFAKELSDNIDNKRPQEYDSTALGQPEATGHQVARKLY